MVCCCCNTIVGFGSCTKIATEREVEVNGCLKLPTGKSSESMEPWLAEIVYRELKEAGFADRLLNVTLDGDSKVAGIVKRLFPNCKVWDCFSHMLVNFRKRLSDLGLHKLGKDGKDGPTAWFERHRRGCDKRKKQGGGDHANEWDCIRFDQTGYLFGWKLSRNLSVSFYQTFTPETCLTPESTAVATARWPKEVERIMRYRQGLPSTDHNGEPFQLAEKLRRDKGEVITCSPLVSAIEYEIDSYITKRIPSMIMPAHGPSVQAHAESQHAKARWWNVKSSQPAAIEYKLRGSLAVLDGCFIGFLSYAMEKEQESTYVDYAVRVYRAVEAKLELSAGHLLGEGAIAAIMRIRKASVSQSKYRKSPKGTLKHAETKQALKEKRYRQKGKDQYGKGIGIVEAPAAEPAGGGKAKASGPRLCACGHPKATIKKACRCGHDGNPACTTCGRPGHESVKQHSLCLAAPRNAAAGKMAMDTGKARESEAADRAVWASAAASIYGNFC